jgi:UDP-glucose 4-epimerase
MPTVVVTGGAGFIGSHVVDAFLADGYEVHVLDDLSSGSVENLSEKATLHELDICSEKCVEVLRSVQPDVIVHAAAQISVRISMLEPVLDTRINLVGLVNILNAFQGGELPYFLFISTGGAIYGEQEAFPAPEDHPIRPTSVYGLAKHVSETYLDFWSRELGLKHAVVRLGNVYGPRQNPHGEAGVVAIFNRTLLDGNVPIIFGSGEQTRDFVYVGDVVRAVKAAVEKKTSGTYNIGTGIETSVNRLYEEVCRALEVEVAAEYKEGKVGEQQRSCISPARAASGLNWKPEVDLATGFQMTSKWFRETHK